MISSTITFAESLEFRLSEVLRDTFLNEKVTPELLTKMRDTIHVNIVEFFLKNSHNLSHDSLLWLTNKFFRSIRLNSDGDMVQDLVVFNDISISELNTNDVQLLESLFRETQIGEELSRELEKRIFS